MLPSEVIVDACAAVMESSDDTEDAFSAVTEFKYETWVFRLLTWLPREAVSFCRLFIVEEDVT